MKTFYLKHFFKTSLLMLTLLLGTSSWGQAELPFTFNGGRASINSTQGLSYTGLGSDYSDSNTKLKFDNTNDYLTLNFTGEANELTFTIKFNGSGTFNGTYNVLGSSDGVNFDVDLFSLGAQTANTNIEHNVSNIPTSVKYIRWIYTNKTSGNIGLGKINLTANTTTTPTLNVSTNEITGLNYIFGNGPSDAQSFTLSGTNLDGTGDVMIGLDDGASSDFEISLNATSGYDTDLFIEGYDGTDTEIFVRLKAGKAVGDAYGDIITIFGDDTNEVYVLLMGEVTPLPSLPVITEAEVTGTVGVAFEYQVVATYEPDTYFVSSDVLPAGLSLDTTTGLITGTPTTAGEFLTGIRATNAAGTSNEGIFIFEIAKGIQTIEGFTDQNKYISDVSFTFPTTTNAGLTVDYDSDDASVATVSGNTITITGIGTTTIWAMSGGDANWEDYIETITLTVTEVPDIYLGQGIFKRVTSTADLTDGYYVITDETSEFLMTTTRSGSATTGYFMSASAVSAYGFMRDPETTNVWKIETNGAGKTIYNEIIEKYVGWSSGNSASIENTPANSNRWTFTFADDKFTVNNLAVAERQLSYNSSSPRFAAYANAGQQELQLYKLVPSTTWNGTAWSNGAPDNTKVALFDANYTLSGNIDAADVIAASGIETIIADGTTLTVDGVVFSDLSVVVEDGGNLIQTPNFTGENVGTIKVKKNSSLIKHLDYTIWSSPVAGQGLQAFSPQTLDYRIYSYATTSDTWVQATGNFEAGRGYMFRAPNDFVTTPYIYNGEFNGVANNGDITVNFTPTGLYQDLGNPYPSNININQFWAANPGTATLYFWTNTNAWNTATQEYVGNNWATYSSIGGTAAVNGDKIPTNIIQTGQGFVVETNQVISSVTFDNTMRTANNTGVFFRNAAVDKHRMWLGFSNENMQLNQILIGYMDGATNNFDLGIDSRMFSYNGSALFSIIENETDQFTIQGRAMPFTSADVVPLGLKAISAGTFTISLTNFDGLFTEDQDIFLNDNLTQTQHNLKDGDYTFVSTEGTFLDRFEVVYTATMSINNPELANAWVIYNQDNNFNIEAQSFELKDVVVYDMLGRVIYQSAAEGNSHVITNLDSNAVMIVKITTTDGQEFSRKVAK